MTGTAKQLEAGAELDALVAEKVMGWPRYESLIHEDGTRPYPHCAIVKSRASEKVLVVDPGGENTSYSWCPSEDIEAAWSVVEKMREAWPIITIEQWFAGSETIYRVRMQTPPWKRMRLVEDQAQTAPLAICLAALKELGAK